MSSILFLIIGMINIFVLVGIALISRRIPRPSRKTDFQDQEIMEIADNINLGLFSCDEYGRVECLNSYAREKLGFKRGIPISEFFFPENIREELLFNEARAKDTITFKVHGQKGDFLIRLKIRGPQMAPPGFYGTIRNITEEERSKYYTEKYLKQSGLVFLGSIFESLAHEIRTPCLAAEACFRMIQEDILDKHKRGEQLEDKDVEALVTYCRNGTRTTSQISELLNHSRSFRRGCRESDLGDIELEEACTYCKETIEAAFNTIVSKKISLEVCGNGPYIVKGYLNRFLEALGNILKNSVEAIIERSRKDPGLIPSIAITIKREKVIDPIDIESVITLSITDNGCGFEEEVKHQIGTALFSTKTRDPSFKGTGLGLTLTIQTINSIGGTWDIENIKNEKSENVGCRTIIKIPIPQQIRSDMKFL